MAEQPTAEPMSGENLKCIKEMTYADEFECDEPNTKHFRHPWCRTDNGGALASRPPVLGADTPCTIPNCFKLAADKFAGNKYMGSRAISNEIHEGKKKFWKKEAYTWRNYKDVFADVIAAAGGLLTLPGIKEKRIAKEECICALLAETSSQWQQSAQAALQCGLTITTVYATLGAEAMLHGLQETKAEIIFVDWVQYESLKTEVLAKCPDLKYVILIGEELVPVHVNGEKNPKPFPTEDPGEEDGKTVMTWPNMIKKGAGTTFESLSETAPVPEDIALIMYTSGSTGLPKGVVLTHANFVAVVASAIAQGVVTPLPSDVVIAYLPLAHIFELIVEVATTSQGGGIGYAHPRSLTGSSPYIQAGDEESPDLTSLSPTLMAAVPAILDLIQNGLKKKLNDGGGVVKDLFAGAMSRKMGKSSQDIGFGDLGCMSCCSCLDGVIMGKVKDKLGMGNVRLLISGGAPLSGETQAFCSAALAPVAQGYGATETVGCATVQEVLQKEGSGRPVNSGTGHVGAIQPATEVKLLSVEEMGYLVTDSPPRGEILVSGNNVSDHGYYKLPEKTAEDFITHPDGKIWFHTGDIGVMMEDGNMKIVDRKKDLIKLSGGEYVSLGKVEAGLKQVKGIGACVVFAQADKDHCVVIVSQPEKGWGSVGGKPEEEALVKDIAATLKKMKFAKFEIPTKAKVCDGDPWVPESGLVTASLKVQRNPLRNHYNGDGGLLAQMGYQFPQ